MANTNGTADSRIDSPAPMADLSKAVMLYTFIAALEETIVSTAAESISRSLNSTEIEFTWIGTAYLLPAATSTPPFGKLSDIFGRNPILMLSIFVFFIGALATNIDMLLAGRVIQGIGGGSILGLSATVIGDVFSPCERSKYYGPIIGGAFAQFVSWRWCFWINRTTTIVGATVMFLLCLGYGGIAYPWGSSIVVYLIVFGIVTFTIYAVIEWKVAKYPLTPLRLFKSASNIATFAIAYIHGLAYIANLYYLPLYFQIILGATLILSGVYLLPVAMTGVYISHSGRYRLPIYIGLILMILGHGLYLNLQPYASWPRIIIYQIISGLGLGPLFQAPIIAIFTLTKPADTASAAATVFFMRDIATAQFWEGAAQMLGDRGHCMSSNYWADSHHDIMFSYRVSGVVFEGGHYLARSLLKR
ncbi:major facilitator superfamily domain-containing protein [Aspergillus stella-maris]|uniref:major facilitator superfamily domain-containing protein n=1 Tax=Aspergillus stella-maris TaxID=1810926 RepID=UPI003CCDD853